MTPHLGTPASQAKIKQGRGVWTPCNAQLASAEPEQPLPPSSLQRSSAVLCPLPQRATPAVSQDRRREGTRHPCAASSTARILHVPLWLKLATTLLGPSFLQIRKQVQATVLQAKRHTLWHGPVVPGDAPGRLRTPAIPRAGQAWPWNNPVCVLCPFSLLLSPHPEPQREEGAESGAPLGFCEQPHHQQRRRGQEAKARTEPQQRPPGPPVVEQPLQQLTLAEPPHSDLGTDPEPH